MTKTIKLSLAAAMVAGIATTASASALQDAIQNVDVSGYVDYRLEHVQKDNTAGSNVNEYAVNVTLTSKVNDMVKATVSAGFDEEVINNEGNDISAPVGVDQAYFTFDLGAATVMAGKQNIPSVFVDQGDTVIKGTGVVALSKVNDALTVAAAHFTNTNMKADGKADGADISDAKTTELVAMGKAGMVNYGVHYNMTNLNASDTELKGLFATVGAKIEGVKVFAQTAKMSASVSGVDAAKDGKVTIAGVAGKVAGVSLDAKYFTAKDNNTVDVSLNGDNDSKVHAKVWQASTAGAVDMNGFVVKAGMDVANGVNVALVYADATDEKEAGVDTDYTEIMPMITYKMSKNFTLHARYSMLETKTGSATAVDTDKSRVQVKYTF